MKYDIFFHDDFDGIASAAVVLDYLKQKKISAGVLRHISYGMIDEWRREDFFRNNSYAIVSNNPRVVVDFPYHPQATLWFDHHDDPFQSPGWKKNYVPSKETSFDPSYASCASYVADSLKKNFGYNAPPRIKELCKWADIIDGAKYKSAKQTINKRESALQIAALADILKFEDKASSFERLARDLSQIRLSGVVKLARYASKIASVKVSTRSSMQYYRKYTSLSESVTFVDETSLASLTLRYAPFALFPECAYAIRMYKEPEGADVYHFSVGFNPWRAADPPLHVGLYLKKKFKGGGHLRVGGCEVAGQKNAQRAVKKLIADLNASLK